jgi:hypothetical protein
MDKSDEKDLYHSNTQKIERLNMNTMRLSEQEHFCTAESFNFVCDDSYDAHQSGPNYSLLICEKYPASYQSKEEQINAINNDIKKLRQSKIILRQTLKQLDSILQETDCPIAKPNKPTNPYLTVKSLANIVPYLSDSRPTSAEKNQNKINSKKNKILKSSIFDVPFNPCTFTDKTIHDHERNTEKAKKKPKKKTTNEDPYEPCLA